MKKWFLFLFILTLYTLKNSLEVKANSDYLAFEEIEIKNGEFLKDISKKELDKHYKKISKRQFYGWKTHNINVDKKVTYKTETLFSYHNDGTTPIKYSYSMKKKEVETRSLSSSGDIKVKVSGKMQKFDGNLDSQLKLSNTSTKSREVQEEYKIDLNVDPGTKLNLYIYGEGKITNGVAIHYMFWLVYKKGGYEVFTITTQYYRLEKVQI